MIDEEKVQISEFSTSLLEWLSANSWGIITALIVLIIGWISSRYFASMVRRLIERTPKIDKTIAPLLSQLVRYAILIVTIIIVLNQFGVATNSMLAVLGAAGLAIALALQGTLSNVAAGVMLIWLRPFSIGDYIKVDSIEGTVKEIGLFSTKFETANGVYIFVPNSQIWSSAIVNFDKEERRRVNIKVGISYEANIEEARKILLKIAKNDDRVLDRPEPAVYVDSLGDSAVILTFRAWVKSSDYYKVQFFFNEQIKLEFDKGNIEIPYNKLDVNLIKN